MSKWLWWVTFFEVLLGALTDLAKSTCAIGSSSTGDYVMFPYSSGDK